MSIGKDISALDAFLLNKAEAESYLLQYGESATKLNKGVSLSYDNIAKADPLFIWFSGFLVFCCNIGIYSGW